MRKHLTPHASADDLQRTINRLVAESIRRVPGRPAITVKRAGEWQPISYDEIDERVRRFSLGLRSLGLAKKERVAILSENRPEWVVADLATLAIGAVCVPVYPSLPAAQVAGILADCGARAVIVSDAKQAEKIASVRADLPRLEVVVCMDADTADPAIPTMDYLSGVGEGLRASMTPSYEELRDSVLPGDLASLVYTSGTTGEPKGAMLTHGNLYSAAEIARTNLPFIGEREVMLSFLPLCHIFERITCYLALGLGANTYYSEGVFKLQENMAQVSPTVMQNVPRVYETIHARIMDTIAQAPPKRRKPALWALAVGAAYAKRRKRGRLVTPWLALQHKLADKLVLSKIRERIGKRWRFLVSGGAPLSTATGEFFEALGIPMIEGYGLTESCAALVINPVPRTKIGTVGKVVKQVKLKIAPDGELLFSGPNIMQGYWGSDEATRLALDDAGWLHTGDIGTIDKDGYLTITDRKKDIIVLANGKNVAPQPIETSLKSAPLVGEVILLGDRSGTVGALVVPDFDQLRRWAQGNGLSDKPLEEIVASPEARRAVKAQIDERSSGLADFEKIRRIALLQRALSIDEGELTPTHKVRRRVVQERYGHLLD